jgi:hypothetical protein
MIFDKIEEVIEICKPPPEIASFIPGPDVIFYTKGKFPQRNIFKCQEFSEKEQNEIRSLKAKIKSNSLMIPNE